MARYHLDEKVNWDATSILARCKAVGSFGALGSACVSWTQGSWTHASDAIAWKERLAGKFNSKSALSSRKRSAPMHPPPILCAETSRWPPTRGHKGESDVRQVRQDRTKP